MIGLNDFLSSFRGLTKAPNLSCDHFDLSFPSVGNLLIREVSDEHNVVKGRGSSSPCIPNLHVVVQLNQKLDLLSHVERNRLIHDVVVTVAQNSDQYVEYNDVCDQLEKDENRPFGNMCVSTKSWCVEVAESLSKHNSSGLEESPVIALLDQILELFYDTKGVHNVKGNKQKCNNVCR